MIESTYCNLVAWQRGIDLVIDIYSVSEQFPSYERFGLTQQLRRAGLSVPCNIAEGRGRGTRRDFRHFLLRAWGSLYEIETIAQIAHRLGYLTETAAAEAQQTTSNVIRPLNGLIKSLGDEPACRSP